jgi:hypothetical protein
MPRDGGRIHMRKKERGGAFVDAIHDISMNLNDQGSPKYSEGL